MDEITERVIKNINEMGRYFYHTMYLNGKEYKGMRNPLNRINRIDFIPESCSMLDLGCNVGGMIWPYRFYFYQAVGVDHNEQLVNFCRDVSRIYGIENKTRFLKCDLDKSMRDLDYLGKFDVIFLLALTQHLKNWKDVIRWAHDHSDLLIIEYNGQPKQVKEYIDYTKTLRDGLDYLGEFSGRYMYVCYNPIIFEFDGKIYNTYKYNRGSNVETYLSPSNQTIIKVYKNKFYKEEVEWCNKLNCAPDILYFDEDRDVFVQNFVGPLLTYYNMPNDYESQINNIKKELKTKGCNGEDVEMHIKDGKIKLIDFGACREGDLRPTIDINIGHCERRRKQYVMGDPIYP
jgi:hypothetical protein